MRPALSSERGTTLIEVLMAGTIMLAVLSATLMLFDSAADNHLRVEKHNEAQDTARRETDRLARQLRNLASPRQLSSCVTCPASPPEAVDRAQPYDFVFRVVDDVRPAGSANLANVKRVRYCLDTTDPTNGRLRVQQQRWVTADPPLTPPATSCPGAGWDGDAVVTSSVVNHTGATPRPLFVFDSTDPREIAHVRTDLFVDADPASKPLETRLTSGVFLRNQNRAPTADFTATVDAGSGQVILNASLSDDPESFPLAYEWYRDGNPIGEGVVFNDDSAVAGAHVYRLVVRDSADLEAEISKTVTS